MGAFHSKVGPAFKKIEDSSDVLDPRSPTVNINRSPIGSEQNCQDKPAITKVLDLTSDLTAILDNMQTPDHIASETLQSVLDPRSPSSFNRTPLVLDESNASNISLHGSSVEYEEITCEEDLSYGEKSISFKDCEDIPEIISTDPVDSDSIFSITSLNTELKAEIDNIIQGLYEAGKDPRSPSTDIQRTPIVFEEDDAKEEQNSNTPDQRMSDDSESLSTENEARRQCITNTTLTIIHQDENQLVVTPKREKIDQAASKNGSATRTPLSCVTNQKTLSNVSNNSMRKTALFGQMKHNLVVAENSAEIKPNRKSLPRSKIPTFRMK